MQINDPLTSPQNTDVAWPTFSNGQRVSLYALLNMLFGVAISVIDLSVTRVGHDPLLFLILLFSLCTSPLLFVEEANGRHCILVISMPVFFIFYGMNDVLTYFYRYSSYWYGTEGALLTEAEVIILLGLGTFLIGFSTVARILQPLSPHYMVRDWPVRILVLIGSIGIILGIWATWTLLLSVEKGAGAITLDPVLGGFLIAARMMEAVGTVLLTYAYLTTKSRILLWTILAIILFKVPMGLVLDSKEIAVSSLVIFVSTKWLHDGGIPIRWLGVISMTILLTFPLFYSYRTAIFGERHFSKEKASANVSSSFEIAMKENSKKEGGSIDKGIQAFATRVDLKSLMSLIVAKVGTSVKFQEGYTLSALPYAFIPRALMPDKPNISVGRLFNRVFHISSNPDTYIATSFLGELYWNFGWPGVLVGMFIVGTTLGVVSTLFNVQEQKSAARLLLLISALYLLSFRFEASIAQQYTVFLRSTLIVIALHMLFRTRVQHDA